MARTKKYYINFPITKHQRDVLHSISKDSGMSVRKLMIDMVEMIVYAAESYEGEEEVSPYIG